MNKLDQLIEDRALQLFMEQGLNVETAKAKVKELKICVDRGYNTRVQILSLIKVAKVSA